MNGIYFALRSGSERHDLRHDLPQLQLEEQAEKRVCLHYCEDVSENPPGRVEGKACETKELWCTMKTLITQVVASSGCTNCTRASVLQTTQRMPSILRPLQKPMLLVFGILPSSLATVNLMALLLECAKLLAFKTNHYSCYMILPGWVTQTANNGDNW